MTKQKKVLLNYLLKEYLQQSNDERKEYGIRWSQFNRQDRLITKQKIFSSQKQLDRFIKNLQKKDNFNKIQAWLG